MPQSWTEKDGSIILGGVAGITKFHPENAVSTHESKDPVLLSLKAIDQNFEVETIPGVINTVNQESISLKPDQRTLIIDFAIPEYTLLSNANYQYKLIGNDEDWITAERRDIPARY